MRKPSLYKSFGNAFRGIFFALQHERNFKIEISATLLNIALIFYLSLSTLQAFMVLMACALVLVAEAFNTALEKLCDVIQPEYDSRIKIIKDASAGAVLLATFFAVIIGFIVYLPYFF